MYRMSSASVSSAGHSSSASAITSSHQLSRPSTKLTSSPVRLTTTTFSTLGARPDDRPVVALALLDLVVQAVVGGVDLAPGAPLGLGRIPVESLIPLLE